MMCSKRGSYTMYFLFQALVFLTFLMVGRVQACDPVNIWGSYGTGGGQFNSPFGVAVDSSGNVYVADTGNHRIQKFNSSGGFLTACGSEGSGDGQFYNPYGVAVDSSGNVYVADYGNHRIQEIDTAGTSASAPAWTTVGSTGTVDEADTSLAVFSGPTVAVRSGGSTTTLDMRYNLVEDGLMKPLDGVYLKVCTGIMGPRHRSS